MKKQTNIKFVCVYEWFGSPYMDVIYKGRYSRFCAVEDAPKTVREFLQNATKITTRYNKVYKRDETFYEMEA